MGLRDRLKGLSASTDELERDRLSDRFGDAAHGQVPLVDAPLRTRICVAGEVSGIRVVPRAGSPSLEITVDDGSARLLVVFTGRKRIAGVEPGRAIVLEGVSRHEGGRRVMLNPAYTLLA